MESASDSAAAERLLEQLGKHPEQPFPFLRRNLCYWKRLPAESDGSDHRLVVRIASD